MNNSIVDLKMKVSIFTLLNIVLGLGLFLAVAAVVGLWGSNLNAGVFEMYPAWFTEHLSLLAAVVVCGWLLNPARQIAEPFALAALVVFPSFINIMTDGEVAKAFVRNPEQGTWAALLCVAVAVIYFVGASIARLLKIKLSRALPAQ